MIIIKINKLYIPKFFILLNISILQSWCMHWSVFEFAVKHMQSR